MSNSMDPEQDQHDIGPDLGSNYLQRLSADKKVTTSKVRIYLALVSLVCIYCNLRLYMFISCRTIITGV